MLAPHINARRKRKVGHSTPLLVAHLTGHPRKGHKEFYGRIITFPAHTRYSSCVAGSVHGGVYGPVATRTEPRRQYLVHRLGRSKRDRHVPWSPPPRSLQQVGRRRIPRHRWVP